MKAKYLEISGRAYYAFEEPEIEGGIVEKEAEKQIISTPGKRKDVTRRGPGFWRRQFQPETTRGQRTFDWFFGVITPVICFFFDPIVFVAKDERPLMGGYKTFAYILSFSAIMATMAWLVWGEKLKWLNVFIAGLLTVAGVAGAFAALVLTPFSLIGLVFYFIGALGLTAWPTSFVFLRNAVRSYRAAKPHFEPGLLKHAWMLSSVFSFAVPFVFNKWMR